MPGRIIVKLLSAAALGGLLASCAGAYGMTGNDTGGIIPWSPAVEQSALDMANGHCARYGRYAVITSIHPWPGDYIGFVCRIPDRWGPMLR
ncbi:MAG: hypothetical protein AB7K04_09110 [Pseudorhodoplanes sp.]